MGDGEDFENAVAEYYRKIGYEAELTSHSHDYGADIILFDKNKNKKIVVQAKYLSDGKVSIGAVQEVSGAIKHYHANEGWVVTNTLFTNNAIQLAKSNKIQLIENFYDSEPKHDVNFFASRSEIIERLIVVGLCVILIAGAYYFSPVEQEKRRDAEFDSLAQNADKLFISGQYLEAIEQTDLALSIYPSALLWTNKGACFENLNRLEDALNCYNRAIEINPEYAKAWHGKAYAIYTLNRSKASCSSFARAYALDPNNPIIKSDYYELSDWCNF